MTKKNIILENKNKVLNENFIYKRPYSKVVFGFLIYLMSDCILFSVFFSVYFILSKNIHFNIFDKNVIDIYYVFLETIILLVSSFTYSISALFLKINRRFFFYFFMYLTFLLGFIFILMELNELYFLNKNNFSPFKYGCYSSFFALLILHAIHIFLGLFWIILVLIRCKKKFLNKIVYTQIFCLGLFWHFLDIIWICIFNFIYLFGLIK
ncbi:cytochrome c oxidase subunit 3 [Buchnera aphidicola (Ceratoglyphina bambusae)]|uniref:cytochrome c oxidase subunit 3 n=1 Tax=Buchnera aphidicola TaxID=9 RepID=UPI0031B804FC